MTARLTSVARTAALVAVLATASAMPRASSGQTSTPARPQSAKPAQPAWELDALVARISEPGGYFDTDNLISNESSYLHAVGQLRALRGAGPAGAYVGVGPDQNFSYIAAVRPKIAFILDIRRDNLLQHLLFKALFGLAQTRAEYLALLTGRAVPEDVDAWRDRSIEDIVAYVDRMGASADAAQAAQAAVRAKLLTIGLPLLDADLATIARFHGEFIASGLVLRFTTHGRAPRPYYPTLRQLVLERDIGGKRASYLATEDDFRFLKGLQARDGIVPVVGDLGGPKALAEIGRVLEERGERVVALYTSNVEYYLLRQGSFARYATTVGRLPLAPGAVVVRSYFGGGGAPMHPQAVAGFASVQTVHRIDDFLLEFAAGTLDTYEDVVTRRVLDTRAR